MPVEPNMTMNTLPPSELYVSRPASAAGGMHATTPPSATLSPGGTVPPGATLSRGGAGRIGSVLPDGEELIPGYIVEESIGSGGFGEVFAAVAPGGIRKAVKIVYGALDESRAERELKSLERVKEVRHPFVISIDRIELTNNRLVIVTELADESLRQRFDFYRGDEGGHLPGIPREELLAAMADAADALDFLYAEHSLQHLDVKPENLLLLSGHVKVADFGLLKDLRDKQMSMMGGVTPVYAPPEVLDGQPDARSDQYALAIVYQEMLTGQLPFNGRTPGQLAAQHLKSAPNLTPLPTTDRYAIGRALSKTPARRFATCREMVEALRNPPKAAIAKAPSVQSSVGSLDAAPDAAPSNSPLLRAVPRTCRVSPPQSVSADAAIRPTVVIGLGGIGCEAVRRFRRDAVRQFGAAGLPSIQLLGIDIDGEKVKTLRRGFEADDADALQPHEVLHTPLRPAADYREDKDIYLAWLSRRWLYNVPRSLTTEGMRPLGRLAMVDNAAAVRRRIEEMIDDACREAAAGESAATSGMPFRDGPPQVFLVGSSTGGTASGAFIDLAYGVAEILRDRGVEARPHGLLLHALPAQAEKRDLAVANSVALLGELFHFDQSGEQWPGDGRTFEPCRDQPLGSVSLMDCPDRWDDQDAPDHPTETAAAYLMQNVLGSSGQFFDAARQADRGSDLTVRNVTLVRLGEGRRATASEADALTRQVLSRWIDSCRGGACGASVMTEPAADESTPESLLAELGITAERHPRDAELIDQTVVASETMIDHVHRGASHTSRDKVCGVVHKAIGVSEHAIEPVQAYRRQVRERLEQARGERIAAMRKSLFTRSESAAYTLDDVRRRLYATAAALTETLQLVQQQAQTHRTRCNEIDQQIAVADTVERSTLEQMIRSRLEAQTACIEADELQTLVARLLDTGRLFDAAVAPLRAAIAMLPPLDPAHAVPLEPRQLDPIENAVAECVAREVGPYWFMRLADEGQDAKVLAAARQATHNFLRERSLDAPRETSPVEAATPPLAALAGSLHWLASGPTERSEHAFDREVEAAFGQRPTTARTRGADIVLCGEAGDLPLTSVTAALLNQRPDLIAVAARLKSRQDVDWCW